MTVEIKNSSARPPHHRQPLHNNKSERSMIRQVLNIIFMIGAIVGLIFYFAMDNQQTGIIIILVSMVFKFAESALRLFHK